MAPIEGGGFAPFMKRRATGCYPLPDSLSWGEGALVEPLAVSIHSVRRGRMSAGETVVVLGALATSDSRPWRRHVPLEPAGCMSRRATGTRRPWRSDWAPTMPCLPMGLSS